MGKLKLEPFRNEVREWIYNNRPLVEQAIISCSKNCREGIDLNRKREVVCHGLFSYLPYELKQRIYKAAEWQDNYVANLMISVVKDVGLYNYII